MPIDINGSGTITGLSVGGLEDGIITPSELSTGAPTWDSQGNVGNIASINSGPLAGFRNAIINGNFDVWQRGTTDFGQGFRADRWNAFLTAGASMLQKRVTLTEAQRNIIGYESIYAWEVAIFDTTSGVSLLQSIEGVKTFAGQQVTVSFWAFTSTGTCTVSALFSQYFGSGGSPSAVVDTSVTLSATTITTTPTKITGTVTIPSIGGKTLGSNGDDYLGLQIRRAAGVVGALRITGVQVEAGPVATPFERRPIGMELALCQRYYQAIAGYMGGTVSGVATLAYEIMHPVPMRALPSITVFGTTNTNTTGTAISQVSATQSRFVATSIGTGGYLTGANGNLSAEL